MDSKGEKVTWEQPTLPRALWDWKARVHPSMLPPVPGRRTFTIIDGGGHGDGVPCAQLSLID